MENATKKVLSCQGIHGIYSGFDVDGTVFSGSLRCKSWSCPFCGPRKLSQLRKRLLCGAMAAEGVSKHGLKFVTLTFGGTEQRKKHIVKNFVTGKPLTRKFYNKFTKKMVEGPMYDLEAMYDKMSKSCHLMMNALRNRYGKFRYFRICEAHMDGVPHFHILFTGRNISPKSFRGSVERLWKKYGLGFVKVNTIRDKYGKPVTKFNDVQHAINYLLKYLTKDVIKAGRYKRVFTCSRGSLLKIEKKEWLIMEIIMGRFDDNGDIVEKVMNEKDLKAYKNIKEIFGGDEGTTCVPTVVTVAMNRHIQQLSLRKGVQNDFDD